MMLDADVVAVSPSSVYRVLRDAGLMKRHNSKPSLKGKGFQQPLRPHEHWHVDISYINIAGTFFYLCSLLDGCSRFIVHWEICHRALKTSHSWALQNQPPLLGVSDTLVDSNRLDFLFKASGVGRPSLSSRGGLRSVRRFGPSPGVRRSPRIGSDVLLSGAPGAGGRFGWF